MFEPVLCKRKPVPHLRKTGYTKHALLALILYFLTSLRALKNMLSVVHSSSVLKDTTAFRWTLNRFDYWHEHTPF